MSLCPALGQQAAFQQLEVEFMALLWRGKRATEPLGAKIASEASPGQGGLLKAD